MLLEFISTFFLIIKDKFPKTLKKIAFKIKEEIYFLSFKKFFKKIHPEKCVVIHIA